MFYIPHAIPYLSVIVHEPSRRCCRAKTRIGIYYFSVLVKAENNWTTTRPTCFGWKSKFATSVDFNQSQQYYNDVVLPKSWTCSRRSRPRSRTNRRLSAQRLAMRRRLRLNWCAHTFPLLLSPICPLCQTVWRTLYWSPRRRIITRSFSSSADSHRSSDRYLQFSARRHGPLVIPINRR